VRPEILLVEDRETMRRSLRRLLSGSGYSVREASDLQTARSALHGRRPDLVLTDLKLPDGEGTEILSETLLLPRPPPVMVLTAYGSVETAVNAIKLGAYDFVTKPVDSEHLLLMVKRAIEESSRRWRYELLAREQSEDEPTMVGASESFLSVVDQAKAVAPTDTTVLILGESGTGKELLARMIHESSTRNTGSFVPMNCAAISSSLAESSLFGHEKGAFTGALERHRGWFELAHGGTLFLDEIGDLELSLQGKLLRVLENHDFQRVGGSRWIKVDVRVIAASNKNLANETEAGRFRNDLYYRLAVFPLTLPPLRDRRDDLSLLTNHFIARYSKLLGRSRPSLSDSSMRRFQDYHWPGNIRELMNLIERGMILTRHEILEMDPFSIVNDPRETSHAIELPIDLKAFVAETMGRIEIQAIEKALKRSSGRRGEAARLLGLSYRTLLNKLKAYDMDSRG